MGYLVGGLTDRGCDERESNEVCRTWPQTRKVPLFGQDSFGEDGKFLLDGGQLADLLCPPQLERVAEPYAIVVSGKAMEPRYRVGEIVYANSARSIGKGDDVVVQIPSLEKRTWCYLLEFVSLDPDTITLRQLSPERKLIFPLSEVKSVHVVAFVER